MKKIIIGISIGLLVGVLSVVGIDTTVHRLHKLKPTRRDRFAGYVTQVTYNVLPQTNEFPVSATDLDYGISDWLRPFALRTLPPYKEKVFYCYEYTKRRNAFWFIGCNKDIPLYAGQKILIESSKYLP